MDSPYIIKKYLKKTSITQTQDYTPSENTKNNENTKK